MRVRFLLIALAAVALVVGCSVEVDFGDGLVENRDDTFRVGDSPKLEVDSFNGHIIVKQGSDREIRVEAELRKSDKIEYRVTQNGDTVEVEAKKKGTVIGTGPTANIEVTVPRTIVLDLETSNGKIEVGGIEGFGTLRTSNGKIVLEDVKGDFQADTSNGGVNVDGFEGSVRLDTSNGSIDFKGALLPGGGNEMTTSNGGITIALEGEPSVRLDASTSNGTIKSDLRVSPVCVWMQVRATAPSRTNCRYLPPKLGRNDWWEHWVMGRPIFTSKRATGQSLSVRCAVLGVHWSGCWHSEAGLSSNTWMCSHAWRGGSETE
jgi:hypothetical protein